MPKFKIRHITKYSYEIPVRDSANQIMLYPLKDEYQNKLDQVISITGNPVVDIYYDYFGNEIGTFTHSMPHHELIIDSRLLIETSPRTLPLDVAPVAAQWQELETIKYSVPYIDFLKNEKFDQLTAVSTIITEERNKNQSPLMSAKFFCEYVLKNF